MVIYIYKKSKKLDMNVHMNIPMVQFGFGGKRLPRKELDRMFAEASKKLSVPEAELVYERID